MSRDDLDSDNQHEHAWQKEGPVAMRGRSGTELWIVYTCGGQGCFAWKRDELTAGDCENDDIANRSKSTIGRLLGGGDSE